MYGQEGREGGLEEEEAWHGVGYNMPLIPASYHARGGAHIPANNGALMNGPHLHSVWRCEGARERFEVRGAERSYLFVDEAVSYARTHEGTHASTSHAPLPGFERSPPVSVNRHFHE